MGNFRVMSAVGRDRFPRLKSSKVVTDPVQLPACKGLGFVKHAVLELPSPIDRVACY